ncbi:cysteine desulfurase mitochondrial-like [Senna tora]|uniref:Cysteine desulfurase mitochondrial-like n=1 Tax=Senna tora TaxID=362788 RepID=A0A834TZG4_9FABA|nr:cysteine desulfurase mitochondrial-like [Senna tora]
MFEDMNTGGHFMKGFVHFDLRKPIRKGVNLGNTKDGIFWVDFRYEKIPKFCCTCGLFGHEVEECMASKTAREKGEAFEPKDMGAWLKASNVGKKIEWMGTTSLKKNKNEIGCERRVGAVRKFETKDLLEKLARMSMRDREVRENTSVMEGSTGRESFNDHKGRRKEDAEDTAVKSKNMELVKPNEHRDEMSTLACLQKFVEEKHIMQNINENDEEGRVFVAIQNMVGIVDVQSQEVSKENVDPKSKSLNMKMWKRMARNISQSPKKGVSELVGGKRKLSLADMTFNDMAELVGRKITTC